jgi:outer membrane protein
MKKVLCGFVLLGLLIAAPLSYAAEMKFGYFNVQQVIRESARGKKELSALDKRAEELDKILIKKAEELKVMGDELSKKGSMLNEQVRSAKEKEFRQKRADFDRIKQEGTIELQNMEKEIYGRIFKSINKVITKLGDDEKYTLIMEVSTIAYAPKGMDITSQVIKAFDAAKE